jgi:lactosylceramide 4-alpha-galactosyltransferase
LIPLDCIERRGENPNKSEIDKRVPSRAEVGRSVSHSHSVESLYSYFLLYPLLPARLNPHLSVYVIYVAPGSKQYLTVTPALEALMEYSNVKFVSAEQIPFAKDTPLEHFFINQLPHSRFPIEHASDAYRLLTLWLYGGTYLDTDVISLGSIEATPANFACDDGEGDIVSNAIIKMSGSGGGEGKRRKLAEMFMSYMSEHYTADEWGTNGPIVITSILSQICRTNSTSEMIKMGSCNGFHILPESACYPIHWSQWRVLFAAPNADKVMKMINGSMTIHLWNNLSKRHKINVDKDTPLSRIAQIYCPRVYSTMVAARNL